jgi:homoserine kinase
MSVNQVTVRIPASSANLGPGFDAIGLALALYNHVTFTRQPAGLTITVEGEGADEIPCNQRNLVWQSAEKVWQLVGGRPDGLHIALRNDIPVGSGLGSSSAAIIGGLVAANALAGEPLSRDDLLNLAGQIEGHPDNIAPALLGGLVAAFMHGDQVVWRQLPVAEMQVVVVKPDYPFLTEQARAALPPMVSRADAVFNIGRTPLVLEALKSADYPLLALAMHDRLHQPTRLPLMPGLQVAADRMRAAGAAAVALSGAGPSLIAFSADSHAAIAAAAIAAIATTGHAARAWYLTPDRTGTREQILTDTA